MDQINPINDASPDGDWDAADYVLNEQRQARVTALTSLDADPEEAAKAVDLSKATGAPAPLVLGDMENFQQQHRAALTAELLRNNRFLEQYAADPIAARVSNDDWGQLDKISQKLGPFVQGAKSVASVAAEKFKEYYGDQPAGAWLPTAGDQYRLAWSLLTTIGYLPEQVMRVGGGIAAGVLGGMGELGRQQGIESAPEKAEAMTQALGDPGFWATMGPVGEMAGMPFMANAALREMVGPKVAEAARLAKPYVEAGKEPPIGLHEALDQIHAEQAKLDIQNLDELTGEAQKSSTRERSPDTFADFIRQHTDAKIGIDAEAVRKLYGDKEPATDDNLLGFVPDMVNQLRLAEAHGGDVEVPLADWLAKVDPEVAKALHDDIRVRPGGMTLEETREQKPVQLQEPVEGQGPPPEVRPIDAVRQSAGVAEPLFARSFKVEPGPTEPGIIPPTAARYKEEVETVGGEKFSPYLNFKLGDALKQIDSSKLTGMNGIPAVVHEFFKDRLEKIVGNVPVRVVSDEDMKRISVNLFGGKRRAENYAPAFYNPGTDEIYISDRVASGRAGHAYATYALMHEGNHALTVIAMEEHPELKAYVTSMMNETMKAIKEADPELLKEGGHAYAFKNVKEFWAQSGSDTAFQHTLSMLPVSRKFAEEIGLKKPEGKSIYDAFRRIIKLMMDKMFPGLDTPPTMIDALFHLQHRFEQVEAKARGAVLAPEGAKPIEPELPQAGTTRLEDRDLFSKAAAIGLTKKQYTRYMELISKRAEEDAKFHSDQAEKLEREKQTQEWKENFSRVRAEVEDNLRSRPDIAADRFLREGDLYGEKTRRIRLASAEIPEQLRGQLPKEYLGDTGAHPDDVAGLFGYQSGDALVTALARLKEERELEGLTPAAHFSKLVDAETERSMRKQYGSLEENILKEAQDHVISQTQLDLLHEEMLALGTRAHGEMSISKEDVKSWVKENFDGTKLGAHSTDRYLASAGRAGAQAEQALLDEKPADAFKAKQQQYISLLLANEAKKLEKAQTSFKKSLGNLTRREPSGLSRDWVPYLHQQLMKGEVMVKRSIQDLQDQMARVGHGDFAEFADTMSGKFGYPMELPDVAYDDKWRKPQDQMTVSEWRDWSGVVKTLANYARGAEKVIRSGEKQDLQAWLDKAIPQLAQQGTFVPKYNKTKIGQLPQMAQSLSYRLVWMESVFDRWDLGDRGGIFKTTLSFDASAKVNQYSAWVKELSKELEKAFDVPIGLMRQKVDSIFNRPSFRTKDTPEGVPLDMNKENVLAVIKWLGTKSSADKLVRGWMAGEKATKEEVALHQQRLMDWLSRVSTKEDWDLIDNMFRVNDKIYEKYANSITELGGVPAQKVELNPITIHGKTYPGGYSHIIYDPQEGIRSAKLMGLTFDPETDTLGDTGYFRASTPKSHEKARTGYAAPLYLKLDKDAGAMSNIIRDAAIRPFVVNASKIFYNNQFRNAVLRHGGEVQRDMLDPYLKGIAGMGYKAISKSDALVDQTIEYFSRNIISRLIGWNIHTIAKHGLSAAVNSIGEVGLINISREMRNMKTVGDLDPKMTNEEFAMTQSHELQRRVQNAVETYGGQFEKFRVGRQWRDVVGEKGAAPIGYFDLMTATPTWIAEYKDRIAKMAEERNVNLGLAQQQADYAVRRAHGSSAVSSRPEAMRGGALARTFVRLYGFFNAMFQRNYEAMWRTKYMASQFSEGEYQKGLSQIPTITKLMVMGNLAPALIEELVTPYPSGEKDSWGKWAGKMLLYSASGMIPGVREAVHAWVGGFGTNLGILDTGLKELSSLVSDVHKGAKMFDVQHGGKTLKELNGVFADLTGWSNDQVGRLLKTFWDVTHKSAEAPKTPYELGREALTGHARAKK